MKFFFASLFLTCLVIACQPTDKTVHFSADIESTDQEKAQISGMGYEKELSIADGKITDTLQIDKAGIYYFRIGYNNTALYLQPGSNISITANAKDFNNSLSTDGKNQSIFAYLKDKKQLSKRLLGRSNYKLDPNSFNDKIASARDSLSHILENAALDAELKSQFARDIEYEMAHENLIYKTYFAENEAEIPAAMSESIDAIDMHNEEEYLLSKAYQNLVAMNFSAASNKDTVGSYEEVFMRHIAKTPAGNIKNSILYNDMRYLMGPNENLDKMYAFFKEHSTNTSHLKKMEEKYNELLKLAKGEPSPSFNYDNYKGGKTSLEDLAGKYVYIDVWATWCGPCKAEIPYLKETEKKYHDKNIEFVSISIDEMKDNDKWKKMIADKELGGTQLFADKAWQSQFVQDYKINGIPRFILVDPEGKIVSADAPRPSDEKLQKTFDDLSI